MNTGVIIARFQSPYLHEGHQHLIKDALSKHTKLIIVLGISPVTGSRRNPYDYHTRERMIKTEHPGVIVLPLCDTPNDKDWSDQLDLLLQSTFPCESFVLYGGGDSFIPYYKGRFTTIELPRYEKFNATEIRKKYAEQVSDSAEFRAGIVYAYYNQYSKVFPTVDIAIFRNDKTDMLLGKKANSNKWRLVGGFADPGDFCYESAALRELKEECGDLEVSRMNYEFSQQVNDWRYRRETDKIITTVFSCDYIYGAVKAQDDIAEVSWFSLDVLPQMILQQEITEEHIPLFEKILKKYNRILIKNKTS